jgi:hypothetical protein
MKVVFLELLVFKGILTQSAQLGMKKLHFHQFLGYVAMWFVYAPYMLIFVFSISKLWLRFSIFKFFQSCLPLGRPKEEFD